ncbi:MAG: hypothetical protein AAFY34_13270 [Pseudomonadota bacterium]
MTELFESKALFAGLAIALTFAMYVPYSRSILRGATRPHVFSWIIWGGGTIIVFFAQLADGAGLGAWPIGVSGLITCAIAYLAFLKAGDRSIVAVDWVFLCLAAMAVPLWGLTSNALSAVIVLTTVDLLGFGPSFRKAYSAPYEDSVLFFSLSVLRNALVLIALEAVNWTTALFPAAVGAACLMFVAWLLVRRRALRAA